MKILITGSEGNIGKYLVKSVRQEYPYSTLIRVNLKRAIQDKKDTDILYQGNLCDKLFVDKIFQENEIDYVIHAAGYSYLPGLSKKNQFDIINNDVVSLLNVLNNCQKVKKIIYLSSATVYESLNENLFAEKPVGELPLPISAYGQAKYFGEKLIETFSQQHGTNYTIWRMFNVVSPLESHLGEGGHVFVDFYRKIIIDKHPEITIFGDGKQIRCFCWVEDITDAIAKFMKNSDTDKELFNIGSSEQKNLMDLINILLEIGKKKNILSPEYNPKIVTGKDFTGVDSQTRIPDTSKIENVLGWKYKTNFETCFEKFIDYKNQYAD